jgi:hypothetical protein
VVRTFNLQIQGASVTIFRNAFLFAFFVINLDCVNYFYPVLNDYAFVKGALCANLAWVTFCFIFFEKKS